RSNHRRRNALATGGRALAGTTYSVSIRTPEILDKLEQHPIWKERAEEKARGEQAGILVGTGVACATKNYGTGGDCSLASVEIAPDGRIAIHCDGVEIGTGIGTAAANRVAAHLGAVADEIALARVDAFGPLRLVTSGNPYTMDQRVQDAAARNPRWVPAISSGTGASTSAHVGPTQQPRLRASCSASVCGRRRSNCGASRRKILGPTNGRRRDGRTGS